MIFPQDFEIRIGFVKLREQLKSYCLSQLGSTAVDQMVFQSSISALTPLLECNAEFVRLISSGTPYPDRDYWDPRESFGVAAIDGSCLNPEDFLNLRNALRTILLWGNFMQKHGAEYPQLAALAEAYQQRYYLLDRSHRLLEQAVGQRTEEHEALDNLLHLLITIYRLSALVENNY